MAKKLNLPVRALIILLCAVFLVSAAEPVMVHAAGNVQNQIDEISDTLKKLENEQKAIKDSIASAKNEKAQEQVKRDTIDRQIAITRSEIDLLLEKIDLLEQDIDAKKGEIDTKQGEIDQNYKLFLTRMRTMYMYDDSTMLGLLLGVNSYSSFVSQADAMGRVAEHDRNLIRVLGTQKAELEQAKAELDVRLVELESERDETEQKRHTLSGQLQAANLRIQDFSEMERAFNAELQKNQAMYAAMEAELKDLYKQLEWSKNPYVGGVMAWPVPGFYKVTSEFGLRFGGADYHTGIDLAGAGVYGAKVVAANDGTVKYTNWTYTPGKGYGIYVLVDHGGGYSTMYAHLSNILVKVGDEVKKGDPIAEVGSTGWSTGPHLHFEVRINGAPQNPRPYIFG